VNDSAGRQRHAMLTKAGPQLIDRRGLGLDRLNATLLETIHCIWIETSRARKVFLVQAGQCPGCNQFSAGYSHAEGCLVIGADANPARAPFGGKPTLDGRGVFSMTAAPAGVNSIA
jgi:hypothetical protein